MPHVVQPITSPTCADVGLERTHADGGHCVAGVGPESLGALAIAKVSILEQALARSVDCLSEVNQRHKNLLSLVETIQGQQGADGTIPCKALDPACVQQVHRALSEAGKTEACAILDDATLQSLSREQSNVVLGALDKLEKSAGTDSTTRQMDFHNRVTALQRCVEFWLAILQRFHQVIMAILHALQGR